MSRAVTARPARSARSARSSSAHSVQTAFLNYLKQSERPLAALIFIIPLILIHEIGWRYAGANVLAFSLLHRFFAFFGATGLCVPALAIVVILLSWHVARGDRWTINVDTLLGMFAECILLTLPLLALAAALARWEVHPLLMAGTSPSLNKIVVAMGAGIYEELVFRLIGLTLLNVIFVDILRISSWRANLLMVLISGVSFSLYHYLGAESFAWKTCLFRSIAGIYFSSIFLCRGFGITAGSHAAYDVIIAALSPIG
jgi:hypothetical protein